MSWTLCGAPCTAIQAETASRSIAKTQKGLVAPLGVESEPESDLGNRVDVLLGEDEPFTVFAETEWRTNLGAVYTDKWPKRGVMIDGECWRFGDAPRAKSPKKHRWPTPRSCSAMASTINPKNSWDPDRVKKNNLETAVGMVMWPTPQCMDKIESRSEESLDKALAQGGARNLKDVIAHPEKYPEKYWPTPLKEDYRRRGPNSKQQGLPEVLFEMQQEEREELRKESVETGEAVVMPSGVLNPDWVDWLMGWPIGWEGVDAVNDNTVEFWERSIVDASWWATDPANLNIIPRLGKDIKKRAERLKCIGNGQVPLCAARAFVRLLEVLYSGGGGMPDMEEWCE